jgi:hypothetical protein
VSIKIGLRGVSGSRVFWMVSEGKGSVLYGYKVHVHGDVQVSLVLLALGRSGPLEWRSSRSAVQ